MDRLIGILQGNAALKITDLRRNINVKVTAYETALRN